MAHLTVCEVNDAFCAARPASPGKGLVVRCFTCGRGVCLSCAVRLEVRRGGLTMGRQCVCHGCAPMFPDGKEIVQTHFNRLGGGRGASSQAPQTSQDAVKLPPVPKAPPKKTSAATRRPRPEPAAPGLLFRPREERQTPAAPVPYYPAALLKALGYGE